MKHRIFALILALSVMSWAQTATQTQNTAPADKAKCSCCEKMAANVKDAHSCCGHRDVKASDSKEMACCSGKDAKCCGDKDAASCDKNCGTDKAAANCCGGNCGKDCKEGACSKKKDDKTASNCCGDDQLRNREQAHN